MALPRSTIVTVSLEIPVDEAGTAAMSIGNHIMNIENLVERMRLTGDEGKTGGYTKQLIALRKMQHALHAVILQEAAKR